MRNRGLSAAQAARIRFAILYAREELEEVRLTKWQKDFIWAFGHPKAWLLDGKMENAAFQREFTSAAMRGWS